MVTAAWMFLGFALLADPGESAPNLPIVKPRDYRADKSVKSATYHRGAEPLVEGAPVSAKIGDEVRPAIKEKPTRIARRLKPRSSDAKTSDVNPPVNADGEEDLVDETTGAVRKSSGSKAIAWWVSTGIGLVVVLTFIFLGGKAVKTMAPGLAGGTFTGPIQVLYRTLIGPKQSVCLLRCGQRLLLVGVTADGMHTLAEITEPEEIDLLKGQCMQLRPKSTTRAFADMFRGNTKELSEPDEAPTATSRPSARPTPDGEFAKQVNAMKARLLDLKGRAQS